MPTLVDSLVVSLGLDSSGFTAGQKRVVADLRTTEEAATRSAKTMQTEGARAAEYFTQIKNEALSLIGVLIGGKGLESFIKDQTRSLSELGRAAVNIGESARDLSAFTAAIERNGGSAQSARDSMLGYANAIERFKVFGDATVLQFLNPIGATVQDSPLQAYMKFVKYVEEHKNTAGGAQLINLIGHGLGYDQGLINATLQMGTVAKYQQELARSLELGVPTQEMIDRVTDLQHSFIALQQAAENLGNVMLAENAGWMKDFLDWLTQETIKNPEVVKGITEIGIALTALAAIRVSAGVMGLTGLAAALDGILATLLRIIPLMSVLTLSGDTNTDPAQDAQAKSWWDRQKAKWNAAKPSWWPSWLPWEASDSPSAVHPSIAPTSGNGAIGGTSDTSLSSSQRALLDAIAGGESSGADPYHQPNLAGGSAFGRYQFLPSTWAQIAARTGLGDINNPIHQDQNAWALAAQEYRRYTFGRDLESDIQAGGHEADIAAALRGRWPSLPGGSQPNAATPGFFSRLRSVRASAVSRPQPSPSVPNLGPVTPRSGAGAPLPVPGLGPPPPGTGTLPMPDPALSTPITSLGAGLPGGRGTSVAIGTVNVHTQATDANGIARDMHEALLVQANRGPA